MSINHAVRYETFTAEEIRLTDSSMNCLLSIESSIAF